MGPEDGGGASVGASVEGLGASAGVLASAVDWAAARSFGLSWVREGSATVEGQTEDILLYELAVTALVQRVIEAVEAESHPVKQVVVAIENYVEYPGIPRKL